GPEVLARDDVEPERHDARAVDAREALATPAIRGLSLEQFEDEADESRALTHRRPPAVRPPCCLSMAASSRSTPARTSRMSRRMSVSERSRSTCERSSASARALPSTARAWSWSTSLRVEVHA